MSKRKVIILGEISLGTLSSMMISVNAMPPSHTPFFQEALYDGGGGSTLYANDLVQGQIYSKYKYVPYLENVLGETRFGKLLEKGNSIFENSEYNNDTPVKAFKQVYKAGTFLAGQDCYEKFDTYHYSIYDMETVVNLPISSESIGYRWTGNTYQRTHSSTVQETYETSVSSTLSGSSGFGLNAKLGLNIFDIGISSKEEISASVSSTWKHTNTTSTTDSITETFTFIEDGYYYLQRRANFDMYVILSFEIPYIQKITPQYQGWWYREYYDYTKLWGYEYLGYKVYYKFRTDCGESFIRYVGQNGNFVFADSRFRNVCGNDLVYV